MRIWTYKNWLFPLILLFYFMLHSLSCQQPNKSVDIDIAELDPKTLPFKFEKRDRIPGKHNVFIDLDNDGESEILSIFDNHKRPKGHIKLVLWKQNGLTVFEEKIIHLSWLAGPFGADCFRVGRLVSR